MTGGQYAMRGYLTQTLVGLLGALEDDDWKSVELEPNNASEKVDILWRYASSDKAVQVKSSQRPFSKRAVEAYATELENGRKATEYELVLVGTPASPAVAQIRRVGLVAVPPLRNLEILAFREQAAHKLERLLSRLDLPVGTGQQRELLVGALTDKLAHFSTRGTALTRVAFEAQIAEWVRAIHPALSEPPRYHAYAGRIASFVEFYTGSPECPVPFGGRSGSLHELRIWLDDSEGTPYRTLIAPTGRGKSALLVAWQGVLARREDVEFVFFPVSARFRTNLASVIFSSLAARLARLHGERNTFVINSDVEQLREIVGQYLRRPLSSGKTLLVVLDGIDEAADWELGAELLPLNPPPSLRVVVSARARPDDANGLGLHQALGWWSTSGLADTQVLPPLGVAGVEDLLSQIAIGLSSSQCRRLAIELHRLSDGDPLLVGMYAREIRELRGGETSISLEDLRQLEPGLGVFLDRWWAEKAKLWGNLRAYKRNILDRLLDVLACAFGPLREADLLSLVKLRKRQLSEALKDLDWLVTGDAESGYVFAHPRLSDHVAENQLTEAERARVEERFLAWGREALQTIAENARPIAPYLVQYYGAHLERSGASPDQFMTLADEPWRLAWEAFEESQSGYLTDVARARRICDECDRKTVDAGRRPSHLGHSVRCALVASSVRTASSALPAELIVALVKKGAWSSTQAYAVALQATVAEARGVALSLLRKHLPPELGPELDESILQDFSSALSALRESFEHGSTDLLGPKQERYRLLLMIGPHLPHRLADEYLDCALAAPSGWAPEWALESAAPYLPLRQIRRALSVVLDNRSETSGSMTVALLRGLAPHLDRNGLESALGVAAALSFYGDQAELINVLGPYIPESLGTRAIEIALGIQDRAHRGLALAALTEHLSEPQLVEEAIEAVSSYYNCRGRSDGLRRLMPLSHDPEKVNERLQQALTEWQNDACTSVSNTMGSPRDLANLARFLGELNEVEVSRKLARRALEAAGGRSDDLQGILPILPQELLADALVAVSAHGYEPTRASMLSELARRAPDHTLPDLLQAVGHIRDGLLRARVIGALAPRLDRPQLLKAVELCKRIGDEEVSSETRDALLPLLPESSLTEALSRIESKPYGWQSMELLAYVSPRLPDRLIERALDIACATDDRGIFGEPFRQLGQRLSQSQIERALSATARLTSILDQTHQLEQLAPHVPKELLLHAAEICRGLNEPGKRVLCLSLFAPRMTQYHQEAVLREIVLGIPDAAKREDLECWVKATTNVASLLPEALVVEGLATLESIPRTIDNVITADLVASGLEGLLPSITDELSERALAVAENLDWKPQQIFARAVLLPLRPRLERGAVALEILASLEEGHDSRLHNVDRTLSLVMGDLPQDALNRALQLCLSSERDHRKCLPLLLERLGPERLCDAIEIAKKHRAENALVSCLGPHLTAEMLLPIARDRGDPLTLAMLANHLDEIPAKEVLSEVVDDVLKISARYRSWDVVVAEVLATTDRLDVTPHLERVLDTADDLHSSKRRTELYLRLAPTIAKLTSADALGMVQRILRANSDDTRSGLLHHLGALAPVIDKLGGPETCAQLDDAICEVQLRFP